MTSRTYPLVLTFCALLAVGCGEATHDGDSGAPGDCGGDIAEPATGKLIFISSERYSADLGGLEGADAKCQTLAEAAGLGGEFKAWLSTLSTSAASRLTHSNEPYVLSNGVLVANDWADLTSGTLRHEFDQTESPELAPPNAAGSCNPLVFWTSTDERGSQFGGDCDGWTTTSEAVDGHLGVISTGATWSTFCFGGCDTSAPILCLEQ